MEVITSRQHRVVKTINALKQKKERDASGLFVVEGKKTLQALPDSWEIEFLCMAESACRQNKTQDAKLYIISDELFNRISDTVTPQGVLAVCQQKSYTLTDLLLRNREEAPFLLIGEKLSDPGNAGALIRSANAFGCHGVILTNGSVDLYNPKVLRASAGSAFNIPVICGVGLDEVLLFCRQNNIKLLALHVKGKQLPWFCDLKGGAAILTGNEARGLSKEALELADVHVKIPMPGPIESLNASVAGSILMYEIMRQRTAL